MFKSKFSKFYALLLLVFGIFFSMYPVSYAAQKLTTRGIPNSTQEIYNEDGSVKQRRYYDEKGKAKKDIDYNHGGKHKFPHIHDWDWEKEKSSRQKARDPKEGELEEAEKITKAALVAGTLLYYVISEGSRIVFPVRNLIPVL